MYKYLFKKCQLQHIKLIFLTLKNLVFWFIEIKHILSFEPCEANQGSFRLISLPCTGKNVQFSCSVLSEPLWLHGLQYARLPCPSPTPGAYLKTHVRWVSDATQLSHPLLSPSPPALNLSQHQSFQWLFRTDLLQNGLVGSPCSLRDSQESSLTPQFKSINSLVLSFLYTPTLTSIHDHWKNHSLD